jgi:hypothetical protein
VTDLDRKLAGLRMLLIGFLIFRVVGTGILAYSFSRVGRAILPAPVAAYTFLAVAAAAGAICIAAAVFARILPSGTTVGERFPQFTRQTCNRVGLLGIPGIILLIGFGLTNNWFLLAPLPCLWIGSLLVLPSQEKYERWAAGG